MHDVDGFFVACVGRHAVDDLVDEGDMFPVLHLPYGEDVGEFLVVLETNSGFKHQLEVRLRHELNCIYLLILRMRTQQLQNFIQVVTHGRRPTHDGRDVGRFDLLTHSSTLPSIDVLQYSHSCFFHFVGDQTVLRHLPNHLHNFVRFDDGNELIVEGKFL